jgi:hypothetical protein
MNEGPINEIAAALSAAQAEMTNPPKTKTAKAGKYSYNYADLAEIIEHIRPTLAKHGLAITQIIETGEKTILVTRLMHKGGQFLQSTYPLPNGAAAQEMGSAITYARRYSLCAILGIAAEEDDDGEKANMATEAAKDELIELMGKSSIGNKSLMDYCRANKIADGEIADDLTNEQAAKLVAEWESVVKAIKAPKVESKPEPKPEPKPEKKQEAKPETKADEPTDDLSGVNPKLAEAMNAAGVTKAMLKEFYTSRKHLPATVEPEKVPAWYLEKMFEGDNWNKAVKAMKGA